MADKLATPQDLAALLQLDYASLSDAQKAAMTLLVEMATARVQSAAGGQRIVEATSTALVDVAPGNYSRHLVLPQQPARSVEAVKVDGVPVTDYKLTAGCLFRRSGWGRPADPVQVAVTFTHGYPPGAQALELARDCVLSLARLGYGNPQGAKSEAIDDYRIDYAEADARMELTEHMRRAIAAAYGSGAYVTGSR
ncbi:hypothetical protein [Micromonospora sp. NPDC047730]|uniref:hypothetical protein n=1 Tax=Micromonospora sp. NPDC047730 TaxID=3364253 RepID=UPI003721DF2C